MKYKLFFYVFSLMGLSLSLPTIASDDDLTRARVGVSSNNFTTIYSGGDLDASFKSLNLGLSYIRSDAIYFDLAYKHTLSGSWEAYRNVFTLDPESGEPVFVDEGMRKDDYDRNDITLTVGKVLDTGVQVFAGYQNSATDIAGQWIVVDEEGFDVSGFFIGVGKSFKVNKGSLNINAAYGSMSAELIDGRGDAHDSTSGSGYSVGATYTIYLNDSLSANFELKQQKYDYDFDDNAPLTAGDDKMTMIGINIARPFQM
mgnify:CR=1 FL=1